MYCLDESTFPHGIRELENLSKIGDLFEREEGMNDK